MDWGIVKFASFIEQMWTLAMKIRIQQWNGSHKQEKHVRSNEHQSTQWPTCKTGLPAYDSVGYECTPILQVQNWTRLQKSS